MMYFKIIQNNEVVNVGRVFLRWDDTKNKMYICNPDDAEFVQSIDESKIYKAAWLKPASKNAGEYETAEVVVIDETEYNDINALLSDGEQVAVEEQHDTPPVQRETAEQKEEKPMTIAEMREYILRQQKQIDALLEKLQS